MRMLVVTTNEKTNENDVWEFTYDNKVLRNKTGWNVPARDVEEALDRIFGYYTGTSYKIVTIERGLD